jgi:hypothetical protein
VTYPYASIKNLQDTGEAALKGEHPALQKIIFINCFLFFWAIFAPLGLVPDPDSQHCYNVGSTYLIDDL